MIGFLLRSNSASAGATLRFLCQQSASAIASSSANLVPEPMEKVVCKQGVAAKVRCKNFGQVLARLFLGLLPKRRTAPGLFTTFDDERARGLVELVRVRDEYARISLSKRQGQAMKQLVCSKPDLLAASAVD